MRQWFLSYNTKSTIVKGKKNIIDLSKIKNLCSSKDIDKKLKRQDTECEKIPANGISDKEPLPEYIKNFEISIIKN